MKSSEICSLKLCSGCAACANICSHNAITMTADANGFLYPKIDNSQCVDCKLCQRTCPNNEPLQPFEFPYTDAFVENDDRFLTAASSGGAFGVMARYVISKGGIVFGSCMDNDYQVFYTSVESIDDLYKLHGSKYVQTQVGMIYREVRKALVANRLVLFCGCPCQVAGVKRFLHKDFDNLITIDLICHGVPSQKYFRDYVHDLLASEASRGITTFRFRYKAETCCKTQHKDISSSNVYVGFYNKDYYMTYFLWGKGYRRSCYQCRFAGGKREGDFTIGDFWNNVKAQLPIDDSRGASLILFNTEKARSMEWLFKENGTCENVPTLDDAIGGSGGQLKHPCKNDIRTSLIYLLYRTFGVAGPKFLFRIEKLRFGL